MNDLALLIEPATVAVALLSGVALGFAYFTLLRRSADALASGTGWRPVLRLSVARLAGAVLVLGAAAQFGAMPLLSVFAGFLGARAIVLRQSRESAR